MQVADIFAKLGEFGKLHVRLLIMTTLLQTATSAITFAYAFLFFQPDFYCKTAEGDFYSCNQEIACHNRYGMRVETKIHSLITENNLYCDNRWKAITGKNISLIVGALGATLSMFAMEKFGRKATYRVLTIGVVFGVVILRVIDSYWISVFAITALYWFNYMSFTNFYVYSTEIFNGKYRSMANTIFFSFNNICKMIYILINLGITHYHSNYIFLIVVTAVFAPAVFFIIETPFFYHRKGDIKKLQDNLNHFNKVNNEGDVDKIEENRKLIEKHLQTEGVTKKELTDYSIMEVERKMNKNLFNEKLTRYDYLKHMTIIIVPIIPHYVGFALIDLVPYKLGLNNIFISSMAFQATSLITNLALIPFLHKIKRRKGNIIIVLFYVLVSVILLMFRIFDVRHYEGIKWTELGLTVFLNGLGAFQFLLISRYVNEVFPTKLRAISISLVLVFGRMSMFLANFVDPLSEIWAIHPFVPVGVFYLLTLPCYWRFEETLNMPTKN